jgi:hypothetical protein
MGFIGCGMKGEGRDNIYQRLQMRRSAGYEQQIRNPFNRAKISIQII